MQLLGLLICCHRLVIMLSIILLLFKLIVGSAM